MNNPPGMSLDAVQYLIEEGGAMILGADNLSFEMSLRLSLLR
jgi:hypothetical protein